MLAFIRYVLFITGGLMLILTVGFFWQMPWAVNLWPWPESRLSYIFLSSITASIAAPSIWAALSEEYGALRGQAITTVAQAAGIAGATFLIFASDQSMGALPLGIIAAGLVPIGIGAFLLLRHYPIKDPRPMPGLVRVSFAAISMILIVVGGALVLGFQIFPWQLKPGSAAVYGWIFLGASTYFLYAVTRPKWHEARGQLWGFLAYDVVLIVPYLAHFERVAPDRLLNLIIYMIVILYSAAIAIYYLFINPMTRPAKLPPARAQVQPA